ncbi:MAG: hypothetical protein A2X49_02835 [Lentisphaerae bacterium GWF2_52_8]|nr:MAG: hypothetical protein A2X49_02835 [Lentisphaerae bacterium GWF2_52_8]
MSIELPLALSVVKFVAILSRISAFMFAFPFFDSQQIPMNYKIFFSVVLSFCLMPGLPGNWSEAASFGNLDLLGLFFLIASEVILGLTISLVVLCIIEVFAFAGHVMAMDMGFLMAESIDPSTEQSSSITSQMLVQVFLVMFLIMEGHHEIIRLAAGSFETLPPGAFLVDEGMLEFLIKLGSQIFLVGMQIALPIFAVIFMSNIALGLIARFGEDFPVLDLSFAIHLGLGLIVLMAIFPIIMEICRKMNEQLLNLLSLLVAY